MPRATRQVYLTRRVGMGQCHLPCFEGSEPAWSAASSLEGLRACDTRAWRTRVLRTLAYPGRLCAPQCFSVSYRTFALRSGNGSVERAVCDAPRARRASYGSIRPARPARPAGPVGPERPVRPVRPRRTELLLFRRRRAVVHRSVNVRLGWVKSDRDVCPNLTFTLTTSDLECKVQGHLLEWSQ